MPASAAPRVRGAAGAALELALCICTHAPTARTALPSPARRAGCLRVVWVYHITWFVNSAAHAWGYQDYETGELLSSACICLGCAAGAAALLSRAVGGSALFGFSPAAANLTWSRSPHPVPPCAGDQSRNNWWVGLLGFGEGWHNNHHAFEFSARHGLEVRAVGSCKRLDIVMHGTGSCRVRRVALFAATCATACGPKMRAQHAPLLS